MVPSKKLIFSLCLSVLSACGIQNVVSTEDNHASGLKQLVENDFVCPANTSRIAMLKSLYADNIRGGNALQQKDAWEALSLIPTEYNMWTLGNNDIPVELRNTGGSIRGVTTLSNDGSGWRPSEMWVAQKTGNFNAMLHEMGHAAEPYIRATFRDFDRELTELYGTVMASAEARYMRGYARSDKTEFFAEIFDSYYCSAESRAFMAQKMPTTLEFARRYLIDPAKLDEGNSADSTVDGPRLSVDTDKDKVSNAFDRCANTPRHVVVDVAGSKYGCPTSTSGNGSVNDPPRGVPDQDSDGVTDAKDKCPDTPRGANVWREETGTNARWLGCSGGQVPR